MTLAALETLAAPEGLFVMGATPGQSGEETLVLLGANAGLWPRFSVSAEFSDGRPDPLDRYSKRVIGAMAKRFDARASYPSDGPPYAPFVSWALDTGRFFSSPVGMLVHDVAGLMVSIRGALHVPERWDLPRLKGVSPCESCAEKPCRRACPVDALKGDHYDVAACKTHLRQPKGQECMSNGCLARQICPVSQRFNRDPAQSAFHMKAFL